MLWQFPRPGDLAPGQTFKVPDDAFFSPGGRQVIVTQEDDFVVSVIDVRTHRIVYRYGHPGIPGSSAGYLYNPDDALLTRGGGIVLADIKNCRLVAIKPPSHQIARQLGETGACTHEPPIGYGSPNGWFPMRNGNSVVTEINGDWIDILSRSGQPLSSTNAPGFGYPSDTNEIRPGVLLSADYENPGAIEMFTPHGRLLWRYTPSGDGRRSTSHRSRYRFQTATSSPTTTTTTESSSSIRTPTGSSGNTATPTVPADAQATSPNPTESTSHPPTA